MSDREPTADEVDDLLDRVVACFDRPSYMVNTLRYVLETAIRSAERASAARVWREAEEVDPLSVVCDCEARIGQPCLGGVPHTIRWRAALRARAEAEENKCGD